MQHQKEQEEAMMSQMMRMNVGQNQVHHMQQNTFDMSSMARDMTGMEYQQHREEAVTRQMMGMQVSSQVDTQALRNAFGAMNMENQPSMEVKK